MKETKELEQRVSDLLAYCDKYFVMHTEPLRDDYVPVVSTRVVRAFLRGTEDLYPNDFDG